MTIAVIALDIAVPIVCMQDLGVIGHQYAAVAGNMLGLAGLCGLYVAGAIVVNTEFGPVLPMPGPISKPKVSA